MERRFEVAKEKGKDKQEAWERKWGKESSLPHYDTGKDWEKDHGYSRGRKSRADYDYVYETRRPRRRRSEDGYRYQD
jgi:hypothetical protein